MEHRHAARLRPGGFLFARRRKPGDDSVRLQVPMVNFAWCQL
jgi:hypothetical protein